MSSKKAYIIIAVIVVSTLLVVFIAMAMNSKIQNGGTSSGSAN